MNVTQIGEDECAMIADGVWGSISFDNLNTSNFYIHGKKRGIGNTFHHRVFRRTVGRTPDSDIRL